MDILTREDLEANETLANELANELANDKESHKWAFFMDKASAERSRTISIVCTSKKFTTDKYNYNIIDTP